ncbi:MAG: B12-binding domain-containing radical SAM protein [Gemmatimonadota bacterium]|nr:MAG: B12-binding domain-containing radical SAM protein [Gemmatimonadota bacterium]
MCKIVGAKYPATPLGLMTVAGLLPQQWEFKLVDANVEPLQDEYFAWADVVCTGGMLSQQLGILSIIDRAHQSNCPVIVGGPDPSSQPDVYQSADYLVLGEGEVTIPMLVEDFAKGSASGVYASHDRADMKKAIVPRFDLIEFKNYIQVGIQYSRGCPFNCEFCDIIELYGRVPRAKTSDQIIQELQTLYDLGYRGHIDFVDDNFIGNKKDVKGLLPAVREWSQPKGYPFYFSTEASINLADDENLLQMMRDVDFRFVFIGIETPENDVLSLTSKKQNVNKSVSEAIRKIHSFGIIVNAGFIIGFDTENDRTAETMITCIQDSGICMAMLGTLYALPNTQLTRRLKREGRLFEEGSTLKDIRVEIDQTTSGLNFMTGRPRSNILKDFIYVLTYIYNPVHYYKRIINTALHLRPSNKYKPGLRKLFKTGKAFLKLCRKVGFNRTTGWLYWKMFFTVLFKNPGALESAVNLAAMFIHFQKQSKFIIDLTLMEIEYITRFGEENYQESVFQEFWHSKTNTMQDMEVGKLR